MTTPGDRLSVPDLLRAFLLRALYAGGGFGSDVNVTNYPLFVKAVRNVDGTGIPQVEVSNFPVADEAGLTNTELRAAPVPVDTGLTIPDTLTNAQLRASAVATKTPINHYASADGGRVAFEITTNIRQPNATNEVVFAVLVNPSNSGVDAFVEFIELSTNAQSWFRVSRNGTIDVTGVTPTQPVNSGGGGASSPLRMYSANIISVLNPLLLSIIHLPTYATHRDERRGGLVLKPGEHLSWNVSSAPGAVIAAQSAVRVSYWQLPAAA